MAWTALTFAFGSTLTSTKMTQMQDNFTAVANGDSGAPNIQTAGIANLAVTAAKLASSSVEEAKLAASSVAQSKLKSTTGDVTVAVASNGTDNSGYTGVLPGGQYGLLPTVFVDNNTMGTFYGRPESSPVSTSETALRVFFRVVGGDSPATYNFTARQRYITSSKPYNLGNGDIPRWFFVLRDDASGKVEGLYDADDPPWAYNGPTTTNPLGRLLHLAQRSEKLKDVLRVSSRREAYFTALAEAHSMLLSPDPEVQARVRAILDTPITQDEKHADMPLIPHPWVGMDLAGKSVVLIDPTGPICEKLWLAKTYGGDDLVEIFFKGHLDIDSTPCGVNSPPGVMAVGCRWRNTP